MNHREPPLRLGARKALHCLSLLLLPALGPESLLAAARQRAASGRPLSRQEAEPIPYLPALGAPPLRFLDAAPPPPDLAARPPAAAPPIPALTPTESSVAIANAAAAQSVSTQGTAETPARDSSNDNPPAGKPAAPAAILPDSVRPPIRAEDFLPYFQPPGVMSAPEPGHLPPSSATYIQTPK